MKGRSAVNVCGKLILSDLQISLHYIIHQKNLGYAQ